MHVKLIRPPDRNWNAEIDQIGALLDASNNPTVFPYHFLQVVLPSLGGCMAEVIEDSDTDTRCLIAGFLLPRDSRTPFDSETNQDLSAERSYTFRYHVLQKETVDSNLIDEAREQIRTMLGAREVVLYSPQQQHNYTMTEELVGNALIGRPNEEEAERIRDLHRLIWKSPQEFIYPSDIHSDEFHLGTSLVARVDGQVAGFLFGFHRFDGPALPQAWRERFRTQLRLESQVMGVSPEYRGMRLGNLLKRAQANEALLHGIDIIHWTADPLMYANAALNFGLLRAISFTFHRDYYPFRNDLNHVPASRLALTWLVNTERVQNVPLVDSHALILDLQPEFTRVNEGFRDLVLDASSEYIAVHIPSNWGEIQRSDIDQALQWREATDALFERYIGIGDGQYVITGVAVRDDERFLIGHRIEEQLWERLAR